MNNRVKNILNRDYTLNDVFVNNYEKWMTIPLVIYLLTPIVHMAVFACLFDDSVTRIGFSDKSVIHHYVLTCELPGDYYIPIIHFSFLLSALFAIIAVMSFLVYRKKYSINRFPDNIPLTIFAVYLLLTIVSTVVNKTSFYTALGFTPHGEGVASLFVYYLVFYLCGSLINNEKYKSILMYFFLITGAIIGILTIINEYITNISIICDNRVCAIFYHWNFYAYYLSISVTLSGALIVLEKSTKKKLFSMFIFILDTFILAINDSLGGFLACIVSLIFLMIMVSLKNHKVNYLAIGILFIFLIIIFITGLFVPSYFSELGGLAQDVKKIVTDAENAGAAGTARWGLWTHTWEYIKEKPYLGWGYDGIADMLGTDTASIRAHNEYLSNMAFYGIPAGLIYIVALISIYIKAIKRISCIDNTTLCCLTAALGYIGSALVGNSLVTVAPFCFIFLGMGSKTSNNTEGR